MALKHTLVAGIAALSLLVTPVGLTVQWNEHGPAIATSSAASTAFAAPNRPTPKQPTASDGPTFTQSGTASKTKGFHPSLLVDQMDSYCQAMADIWDSLIDQAVWQSSVGNQNHALELAQRAGAIESDAQSHGCVFVPA